MWQLFCEKHPDLKVSKSFYWNHFKANFNFRIGCPQVVTCCKFEELNLKLKSLHLNDVAKRAAQVELDVHKRRSEKFYNALKHETSEDGSREGHVLSLAFDYMKTISLPKVPVQQLYYMRQLSVNVFLHITLKKKRVIIFERVIIFGPFSPLTLKVKGEKGPNKVLLV